jgi:hypothetical protein
MPISMVLQLTASNRKLKVQFMQLLFYCLRYTEIALTIVYIFPRSATKHHLKVLDYVVLLSLQKFMYTSCH